MVKKTYRPCVRVLILKEGKVLLGRMRKDGVHERYLFPGGGIEEGDTAETSAVKECLEEVGIQVKNVRQMGFVVKYDCDFHKPERAALYRGCEDVYCRGDYDGENKALYGSEGDALLFTWEDPQVAIDLIENGPEDDGNASKITVLRRVAEEAGVVAVEAARLAMLSSLRCSFKPW